MTKKKEIEPTPPPVKPAKPLISKLELEILREEGYVDSSNKLTTKGQRLVLQLWTIDQGMLNNPLNDHRTRLIQYLNDLSDLEFTNFQALIAMPHAVAQLPDSELKQMALLSLELQKVDGQP